MTNFTFVNATYVPGQTCLEQGYKNGSTPTGFYRGSNGTFLTFSSPQYLLKFKENTTGKIIESDFYKEIKKILKEAGLSKLTKKRRKIFESKLRSGELTLELLTLLY